MRSVVFITLFVLLSVINLHAEIVEAVFVWSKDGTKIGYVLQSTPKMTFSSTDLNTGSFVSSSEASSSK